nr:Ig-like domain-containing protein [Okeania sp. SIO2C9]
MVTTVVDISDNNPPVANNSAITVDEASQDTGLGLTAPTDADGDPLTITVTGLPTLGQVTKVDGTAVNNGDTLTSEELQGLLYDAPSDYNGTDDPGDFTYNVSDGTTTVSGSTDITITTVNDLPILDLDGNDSSGATGNDYTTTFIEGGNAVAIGDNGDVVITDVDDTNIESATITLTNRPDGNTVESLSVNSALPTGITASSYDQATGKITLTGSATLADYQTAIAQITYNNTSTNPKTNARSVTVVVNDGNSDSNTATTTINIIATNSPPVVNSSAITVDEASQDTALGLTAPTDVDGDPLTITVTGLPILGQITKVDGTAVNNGDQLTSEELQGLLYDAPANYNGTDDPGDFTYNVSDGTTTVSGSTDITINVAPVGELADDTASTAPNTPVTFNISDNDENVDIATIDLDTDTPGIQKNITVPGEGTFAVDDDGNLTFTPLDGFEGEASIPYGADDNSGNPLEPADISVNINNQEENTTLNPGDIAFVQYNADGTDNFKFVALVDLPASEEIKFTDKGWQGDNSGFSTGEGIITWTAPAGGISAGTVVEIDNTPFASVGTASESGSLNFAATGDQIIAYQGTNTAIAALNNEGAATWQADATSSNTSALPQGLTNGTNAVAFSEVDNAIYTGITTGDQATLLAALNNKDNWSGSDSTNQTFTATFTINDGSDSTPPTVETFTPADNATDIAVAANLVIDFDENVEAGTGNIVIKQFSDNSIVETIDVTSSQVSISNDTVTINPTADLAPGTDYYIEIAAGAIEDTTGNDYAGILGNSSWNFTTANSSEPVSLQLAVAQSIGGSGSDYGRGIATDSDGNVWTTGYFSGSIDIDGDGNNDLTSNGDEDSYVAKFDSNGNFLFAQNIGGSNEDRGYGIATDNNGNVWATGYFSGSIDIDSDGNNDLTNGNEDSYVAKFDSNGNFQFAKKIDAARPYDGLGIATDSNGNAWATGNFHGSIDIDSDGNNDLTSNGLIDSYVAKFDSNGNFQFGKNIGARTNNDYGSGIATDSNGNVWTTGYFHDDIDIDGDGDNDLTSNGYFDSYVAKFDSNGNFLFIKHIGGSGGDFGRGITTDTDGNAWATGEFSGNIDIDGDGNNDLSNNGVSDSYVAKFDSNGNLLFAQNIGGSNSNSGNGIATDSNGNVWITGEFQGSMDIDGDGNNDLTSNSSYDSYVAKLDSNGNFLFAQNIGGSSSDIGNGIATDSNGNVWATGYFSGSIDTNSDGNNDLASNGNTDSYVVKFSSNVNELDEEAPTVETFTPADNDNGVAVAANLVIDFNEDVEAGAGNIVIKQASDNSTVDTIDVTSGQVTISNNILTINPTADLAEGTEYYVEIAAGAIEDTAGNNYAGITDNSTWNFTTISGGEPVRFDFNSDGMADILWRNSGSGKNQIWLMNSDGSRDSIAYPGNNRDSDWAIEEVTDFNQDQVPDILWRNTNENKNELWFMNSGGTRGSIAYPGKNPDSNWAIEEVTDFNKDQIPDILWRNSTEGKNWIWLMDNDGTRSSIAYPGNNRDSDWTIEEVTDFNQDQVPDILWRNTNENKNELWLMNNDGTRSSIAYPGKNPDSNWAIEEVTDFNQDQIPDILWRNSTEGKNWIWLMNNNGTRDSIAYPGNNRDSDWTIEEVTDFNQDQVPDILWRNTNENKNELWLMNSGGTRSSIAYPGKNPDSNWAIEEVTDFNQDQIPDILWRNSTEGKNAIWLMDNDGTRDSIAYPGNSHSNWEVITDDFNLV